MATPGERRRQAVALAYQDNDRAPRVVAKIWMRKFRQVSIKLSQNCWCGCSNYQRKG